MKKKGFTIIELLAVIVILALIALITTPIITKVIEDSKIGAAERGADNYVRAVNDKILSNMAKDKKAKDGTYTVQSDGSLCPSEEECTEDNKIEIKMSGNKPTSGTVVIENSKVVDSSTTLTIGDYTAKYNAEKKTYVAVEVKKTCILVSGSANTIGSKYKCEVKPGTKYDFYVLSQNNDETTNLILDRNIYYNQSDGTSGLADSNNTGRVDWGGIGKKGPNTSLTYLYGATKDWINIPALNYTYNDEIAYKSFVSQNGIATLTPLSGDAIVIGTNEEPLRARMPIYLSDSPNSEVANADETNLYLYENLNLENWSASRPAKPENSINGIGGYWTLSGHLSIEGNKGFSRVSSYGMVVGVGLTGDKGYGVRPVITIPKSQLG